MTQRDRDDVRLRPQVVGGQASHEVCQRLEHLEVGARLPRRVHGLVEAVHEGVHVRGGQVVLLVPRGGGQHDVGVQRRRGVTEVRDPHEVELAGVRVAPVDGRGTGTLGQLFCIHLVAGTQHVAQEELGALRGRTKQVRTPVREDLRDVVVSVRVLDRELQATLTQLPGHVLRRSHTGLGGLATQLGRTLGERRVAGHPAALDGLDERVDQLLAVQVRGLDRIRHGRGRGTVVTPLVGGHVVPAGGNHLARRARPVQGEGEGTPTHDRADLLLTHVVGPAATVAALGATHFRECQERPVHLVGVVVVVRASAHEDHGTALRLDRVLRELATDLDGSSGGNRRELLLPRGGARRGGVHVVGGPLARQTLALNRVVSQHDVVHGRHEATVDAARGDATQDVAAADRGLTVGCRQVEARQGDLDRLPLVRVHDGQDRLDAIEVEVPVAGTLLAEAIGERAARVLDRAVGLDDEGTELVVLGALGRACGHLRGREELAGDQRRRLDTLVGALADLADLHEERAVSVARHVIEEHGFALADVEFLEDDVTHGLSQGTVRARLDAQPVVRELRVVREVRGHDDDLLTVVAGLGHEVRVGGTGQRQVRAPHDEVLRVEPVAGLGHVGLVAEHLRRGRGQVRVPVVEGQHGRADEFVEAGARAVGDHRHGGDDREAGDAVGTVLLDRVHVGGGDDLHRLFPGHADHAAAATLRLVGARLLRVLNDRGPRVDRIAEALLGIAEHVEEDAAHVGVLDAGRRVFVPRERRATRATAGLVLGHVSAGRRVVSLLGFPGDDAVLDEDLPRAGARAVHAVGGAHDLVVAPAVAVEGVAVAAALEEELARVGRRLAATQPRAERKQGRAGRGLDLTAVGREGHIGIEIRHGMLLRVE